MVAEQKKTDIDVSTISFFFFLRTKYVYSVVGTILPWL